MSGFSFLPGKNDTPSPFAAGMSRGAGKAARKAAAIPKKGEPFDFTGQNKAGGSASKSSGPSGNPFAHLGASEDRVLGMSRKSAFKLYAMVILLGVLVVFLAFDGAASFFGVREKLQDDAANKREDVRIDRDVRNTGDSMRDPNGLSIVADDPDVAGADSDVETPVAQDGDGDGTDSGTGDGEGDGETGPEPPDTDPNDPVERANRIAKGEEPFKDLGKDRPIEIPASLMAAYNNTIDDVYTEDYGELHRFLLDATTTLDPDKVKELAILPDEVTPRWFTVGHSAEMLFGMVGRAFTVEGTVFELTTDDPKEWNVDDESRDPLPNFHKGLISFGYDRIEIGEGAAGAQRATANVLFTSIGDLPAELTPDRVYDENQLPVRVRLTGLFLHLRPYRLPDGTGNRTYPLLVADTIEVIDPLPPTIEPVLMQQIDNSTDYARRHLPTSAQQNLLYYLRHLKSRDEFESKVAADVTFGDLWEEPETYSQKPTVVHFEGQILTLSGKTSDPLFTYKLNPNPYGLRHQYTGAVMVVDERGTQRKLMFDALNVLLWDEESGTHYDMRTALENGGKMPSGKPMPAKPLKATDEIIITGYFLTKWRYGGRDGKMHDVPRLVVHTMIQRKPRGDGAAELKWSMIVIFVLVIGIVFWLFRREQANASEFRQEFIKRHVQKAKLPGKKNGETPSGDAVAGGAADGDPGAGEPKAESEADGKERGDGDGESPASSEPPTGESPASEDEKKTDD